MNLMQDSTMVTDSGGYIVNLLCKEGELLAAEYPAVVFRSKNQVVTAGLSEDDVKKVQFGTKARVEIGSLKSEGQIINIVQMADSQSGTYSAEIKLLRPVDNSKFFVGETAMVRINLGEKNSTWIPISSILNYGEDYVYVVENEHAVRKNIVLEDTYENKVLAEGLQAGGNLVVEGIKNIKAGYQVTIN